jgi:3-oxoacyl-[acyl-carrier protein] reductase
MSKLTDKVALVTGSSRGIGAAIAVLFAQRGARVVLHGRDVEALAAVQSRIANDGGQAIVVTGDVTRLGDLETMRAHIEKEYGPVELLVANAGGSTSWPGPIEDISEESWRADIDANLTATFLTVKCFLPGMKERRAGSILTMSSAAGRRASGNTLVAYGAAKAGVQVFTQDLAAQVGPYGIRVNCIAPETILTEKNEQWIPHEQQRALAESHPLRRLGTTAGRRTCGALPRLRQRELDNRHRARRQRRRHHGVRPALPDAGVGHPVRELPGPDLECRAGCP